MTESIINPVQLLELNVSNTRDNYHQHIIENVLPYNTETEDAVFIINKNSIRDRYQLINDLLPACKNHFAVKSCPQKVVIDEINNMNGYFDVASNGEIDLLKNSGVDIGKCIHTHPIKKAKEISYALENGITRFVVESEFELQKFEAYKNEVELMVRLSFSNQEAAIDLSSKFGLPPAQALAFLVKAKQMGYNICGVCFHVGSQMPSNRQYLHALQTCRALYDSALHIGMDLSVLDIGGGFPFYDSEDIDELTAFYTPINNYLKTHFKDIECLAEPGRFVATPIATLACQIIGKTQKEAHNIYYINEGVYGCISNKVFDFYSFDNLQVFRNNQKIVGAEFPSILYGPTCDSFDKLTDQILLPELQIGDTIFFDNMGAYSIASTTNFNMLGVTQVIILDY